MPTFTRQLLAHLKLRITSALQVVVFNLYETDRVMLYALYRNMR